MERSVLIVEDEPLIADDLLFHLEDMGIENIEVSLKYDDARKQLLKHDFDLALLDVNLSGEKDGIDLAGFINRQCKIPFMFVTSYYDQDTIVRAKKTDPLGYILKPFDKNDIYVHVEMAFHKISIYNSSEKPEQFFVKDKSGLVPICAFDILYVEAFDNYSKVFTRDRSYIISHTLKSVEDKLSPFGFERVHKSYLINFSKISRISEGYIYFEKTTVPIGRAYKPTFMAKISML